MAQSGTLWQQQILLPSTDVGKSLTNSPPPSNLATSIHPGAPTNTQLVSPLPRNVTSRYQPTHCVATWRNMQQLQKLSTFSLFFCAPKSISQKRIQNKCVGC